MIFFLATLRATYFAFIIFNITMLGCTHTTKPNQTSDSTIVKKTSLSSSFDDQDEFYEYPEDLVVAENNPLPDSIAPISKANRSIASLSSPAEIEITSKQFKEEFGATGDGITEDGMAFFKLIEYVNALPQDTPVKIIFKDRYVITGGPNLATKFGMVQGIPLIKKKNVTIIASGAVFTVPNSFLWQRTLRGGDDNDYFAQGFHVTGANFKMIGGLLDGHFQHRIESGAARPVASERNYGGNEYGLWMQGQNWQLSQVTSRNWGTDALLVQSPGKAEDCNFVRGRRNNVSVAAIGAITENNPVIFDRCNFYRASAYPEDYYNAPGSGLQIESKKFPATVIVRNSVFKNSRRNSIRLSSNAKNCVIENTVVDSDIEFRSPKESDEYLGHLGGHRLYKVTFEERSSVPAIYGRKTNSPITFDRCLFFDYNLSESPIIQRSNYRRTPDGPLEYNPIKVKNCRSPLS